MIYYIALDGNDRSDGSFETPFQTLEKAMDVLKNTEAEEITFFLREGVYRPENPLVFDRNAVGDSSRKIVFQNFREEKAVISGCKKLNPVWKPYNESILVAQIGKGLTFDGLFVNGERQILCRYPNEKKGQILDGCCEDALSQERINGWKDPAGGYIRALHSHDWGGNSYIIQGKDENQKLQYQWVGDNNRGNGFNPQKVMVENIFEELDAPKEWFYRAQTGELFYYPPKDKDLDGAEYEAAVLEELFIIRGEDAEHPVKNITIEGIAFTGTHRTMFTKPYERPLRGDWAIQRTGALYLENVENIAVKNCHFFELGGNAVMMSGYNRDHLIDHNDIEDIGASGVLLVGLTDAVRDPSFWDEDQHKREISDYEAGPCTPDYPANIRISGNWIYNNGMFEKQSAGVCMSIAEYITVSGNTIHHLPRAGINISDGTFGGHLIEKNDIFDCVRETGDHGPINTWGRDRFWSLVEYDTSGRYGREKRPFARLDARSTTIIRGNRVQAKNTFGIDLDDGSTNYEICQNLCLGASIKTREGFDRIVHDNILIGCPFEIHVSYAQNGDLFYKNVVYNEKAYNFIFPNEGNTTVFNRNFYWNQGEKIEGIPENDCQSTIRDPMFELKGANDYRVGKDSQVLRQGFCNFPMGDADFGREDKPKPPHYHYAPSGKNRQHYELDQCVLSDIVDEGMVSAVCLPDHEGAMIMQISESSKLYQQGYRMSDVLRKINGKTLRNTEEFLKVFSALEENAIYEVEIYRQSRAQIFEMRK